MDFDSLVDDEMPTALRDEDLEASEVVAALIRQITPLRVVPPYKVIQTSRVSPYVSPTRPRMSPSAPAALTRLNVIAIDARKYAEAATEFPKFVCSSFDMSMCCVSLRVKEDYTFEYECFDDAAEDLLHRRLRLRPQAFTCKSRTVDQQMLRIVKYLLRGFKIT